MPDQPELRRRLTEALSQHLRTWDGDCVCGIAITATDGDATRWEALRERLERADATLTAMACKARTEVADDPQQSTRLAGKASGIRLALSYMQDEENLAAAGVAEEQHG